MASPQRISLPTASFDARRVKAESDAGLLGPSPRARIASAASSHSGSSTPAARSSAGGSTGAAAAAVSASNDATHPGLPPPSYSKAARPRGGTQPTPGGSGLSVSSNGSGGGAAALGVAAMGALMGGESGSSVVSASTLTSADDGMDGTGSTPRVGGRLMAKAMPSQRQQHARAGGGVRGAGVGMTTLDPLSAATPNTGAGAGAGGGAGAGAGAGAMQQPSLGTSVLSETHDHTPSSLPKGGGAMARVRGRVQFAEPDPSPNDDEGFIPAGEQYTPRVAQRTPYRPVAKRFTSFKPESSSVARPDFDDSLRRAAVVVYQHIIKGEKARASGKRAPFDPRVVYSRQKSTGYASSFRTSTSSLAPSSAGASTVAGDEDDEDEPDMTDTFHDSLFIKPQWQYSYVRTPRMGFGTVYKLERVKQEFKVPTVHAIYQFARHLFVKAQLSAECSIVSLIYVERLMKQAKVTLLAVNWRPILLCGMLMASKVWQDLSSWNVEFAQVYPQYTLESINRLEREFLHALHWDLYISGSLYAKYYFALRSMSERKNFRRRYMYIMKVNAPGGRRIAESSQTLKNMLYSKSV